MCSHRDWESFGRRFWEAADEGQLLDFVAETLVDIERFVEELTSRACAPGDASWGCGWARRSQTDWVA